MSLNVSNLSFSYRKTQILKDVSFEAPGGELLAVLGPNGVGKTTLFKCILNLEKSYTGTIEADGTNLAGLSMRGLSHRIAYIPQNHSLSFKYSAFDTVLMGTSHLISPFAIPGPKERELAFDAMKKLHIERLAEKQFDRLSGGEQQLVYIARALCQQAKILLMDEPTSSLDYGNQLHVLNVVSELKKDGYTILLSTHNPQHALWYADRALALYNGKVEAFGASHEIITADLIEKLYGRKASLIDTTAGPMLVPGEIS